MIKNRTISRERCAVRFIITGGGTGGHVYPAIAIAESLKEHYHDARFLYVGVRGRAEEKIVPRLGYDISFVTGAGLSGKKFSPRFIFSLFRLGFGILQAAFIHLRFKPQGVIGTGGYASVPSVMAAVILRRLRLSRSRIFIHEQNFAPGEWNRLIGRWVDRIWISLEGTERFFTGCRVELTGYPIRRQIVRLDKSMARQKLGIRSDARVVFVFGGSQGARSINRALVEALPELFSDPAVEVFHGTGAARSQEYDAAGDTAARVAALGLSEEALGRYHPRDFYHDIEYYYAATDLVVCRAGAGTLNEPCRCGRPALVIPKSNIPGEHQVVNAIALVRAGICEVLFERPVIVHGNLEALVSGKHLAENVLGLLADKEKLKIMAEAALKLSGDDSSKIFVASVAGEIADERLPVSKPQSRLPEADIELDPAWLTRLSPQGVLAQTQKIVSGKDAVSVENHPLVEMFRYFADGYLISPLWQVRNIGVKLVGLLKHRERRELLLALAQDRTPAPLWKRLISGDFNQVGFIRRNAIDALVILGIWDEDFRRLLINALNEDPYYEVRTQAGLAIIELRDKIGSCSLLAQALQNNLEHRSIEVRWTIIEALGAIAPEASYLKSPDQYLLHPNWRIRQAFLKAVGHFLERGLIGPEDELLKRIGTLIPTCTDFVPTFPLKLSLNRLYSLVVAHGKGRQGINGHAADNQDDR